MNADNGSLIVAKKYAHAFLGVYKQVTYDEIRGIEKVGSTLARSSRALFVIIMGAKQANHDALLDRLCALLMLSSSVRQLLRLLVSEGRIELFPLVCKWIGIYFRQEHAIMHFSVTSASELTEKDKAVITHFLKQKTQATIETDYHIDTTLIAGIRIQSGEYLWEKSIARLLRDIKLHNVQ
jgi:ATP synthase F1 delta subunit